MYKGLINMARQKKPVNYDEELEKIEMQITRHKNTIKELEIQRKKLQEEKKSTELGKLYTAIQTSGKTVSEVLSALENGAYNERK